MNTDETPRATNIFIGNQLPSVVRYESALGKTKHPNAHQLLCKNKKKPSESISNVKVKALLQEENIERAKTVLSSLNGQINH